MEGEPEDSKHYTIVEKPDVDIFGSSIIKKTVDCTCPNCERLVAASRFAPHLEKCMGKIFISDKGRAIHHLNSKVRRKNFYKNLQSVLDFVTWPTKWHIFSHFHYLVPSHKNTRRYYSLIYFKFGSLSVEKAYITKL